MLATPALTLGSDIHTLATEVTPRQSSAVFTLVSDVLTRVNDAFASVCNSLGINHPRVIDFINPAKSQTFNHLQIRQEGGWGRPAVV